MFRVLVLILIIEGVRLGKIFRILSDLIMLLLISAILRNFLFLCYFVIIFSVLYKGFGYINHTFIY